CARRGYDDGLAYW
nr:immunoglobulin heavy chain junction region [Mus musculus]MBK4185009.1 immunoglobulin heavy chain junction region [Mus musculus]MBK4185010.1 immunoglobulin heavy chain junction region [Mus musculus]